jgi:hypothetical protein
MDAASPGISIDCESEERCEITVERPSTGDTATHSANKSEIRDINGNKVELTAKGAVITPGPSSLAMRTDTDNSGKSPGSDSTVVTADGLCIYNGDWGHAFNDIGIRFGGVSVSDLSFSVTSDGAIYSQSNAVLASDASSSVGIGVIGPSAKLEVDGTAKMAGFTMETGASDGHVLTSDVNGNGTWQAPGSGTGKAMCADLYEGMTNSSSQVTITFPVTFTAAPYFTVSGLIKSGAHAGTMAHIPKPTPGTSSVTVTIQYWNGAMFTGVGDSEEVMLSYTAMEK